MLQLLCHISLIAASLTGPAGPIKPISVSPSEVGAAVAPVGLGTQLPGSPYANPKFGPEVDCERVRRQLVLLNPSIQVGQPVEFRLLLKSLAPDPTVEFRAALSYGNDVKFIVFPPGNERPFEYMGLRQGSTVPTSVLQFDGFDSFRFDFAMLCDTETVTGAAFESTGVYRIRVQMNCVAGMKETQPLELGEFQVTVAAPEGDNRKALEILTDFTAFQWLQRGAARAGAGGGALPDRIRKMFERIMKEAPKAALTPFAGAVLSDLAVSEKRDADAFAIYDTIERDFAGQPAAITAQFNRVRLLLLRGKREDAFVGFVELWKNPVAAQVINPKTTLWSDLVSSYAFKDPSTQWMVFEGRGKDPEMQEETPPGYQDISLEQLMREGKVEFIKGGELPK